jgi:muramidase (phage lysozyme)
MIEILEMLKVVQSDNELIQTAKGKYQFTGKIFKDVQKILSNGRGNSI